jgi:hypothetical protein
MRERVMRRHWIGLALSLVSPLAVAQSTIYKHVDESGRVTYSNRPMKGATVLALEPLSTIPGLPRTALLPDKPSATPADKPEVKIAARPAPIAQERAELKPVVAVVTPRAAPMTVASIDRNLQRDAEAARRRNLESELGQAERSLADARKSLLQEQRNPALIAAVRVAQQAVDPTPAQQAEMRSNVERASGRIRGLQAIVAEHEKNIEALKNELGALKP